MPRHDRPSKSLRLIRWVACVFATATAAVAHAGVAWHPDVATAHAAAAASRRPLCVVFVADRNAADPLGQTALADPAAEALLAACFEPVCADVASEPELARRLVVVQVPMLYILVDDQRLVTAFPMPATAAEFVTVAAKVAQEASSLDVAAGPPAADMRIRVSPPPTGEGAAAISVVTGSVVTDKFQRLSEFANESDRAAAAWPAERPAAALATDAASSLARPAIEPAPTAPWLAGQPQASATAAASATPYPSASPTTPLAAVPPAAEAPAAKPASPQSSFVETLQKPFTFWRSTPPATAPPAAEPAPVTAARPLEMDPYGSMPLGLEGYCPVTVLEKGTWAEGRPQWGARHRGRTYLFAGQSEQQNFLANPDRYAPALSGDDPVLAFESGTSTPGQRRFGVTYQSRMYLFASPETRAAFTADPARYSGRVALAEQPASTGPAGSDTIRRF
jgi:YHS domain-containing protein